MAYLIEKHYNPTAACMVPEYWQPDGASFRMPCGTKEEAEALEVDPADLEESDPIPEVTCPACSVAGCDCYLEIDHSQV